MFEFVKERLVRFPVRTFAVAVVLLGSVGVAFSAPAATNVWTAGDLGADASWSLGHQPRNGEDVLLALPSGTTGSWQYNPKASGYTLGTASLASFTLRHDGAAQPRHWNPVTATNATFDLPNSGKMWFSGKPASGSGTLSLLVPKGTTLFDAVLSDFTGDIVFSNKVTQFAKTTTVGAAGRKVTIYFPDLAQAVPFTSTEGTVLTFPGAVDVVQLPKNAKAVTRLQFGGATVFNGPVEIKENVCSLYFEGGPLTFAGGIRNRSSLALNTFFGPQAANAITNVITGGAVDFVGTFYLCNSTLRLSAPVTAKKMIAGYYTLALVCRRTISSTT